MLNLYHALQLNVMIIILIRGSLKLTNILFNVTIRYNVMIKHNLLALTYSVKTQNSYSINLYGVLHKYIFHYTTL